MLKWLSVFQSALAREFGDRPTIGVLATVSPDNAAAGRCVVLRDLTADGRLVFTTDVRSEKVHHLETNPSAECVFWLPTLRLQFRIAGDATIDATTATRSHQWSKLSPATRLTFYGPPPGTKRESSTDRTNDTNSKNQSVQSVKSVDDSPPPSFAVLVLSPIRVESLDLTTDPHTRTQFARQDGWRPLAIHP